MKNITNPFNGKKEAEFISLFTYNIKDTQRTPIISYTYLFQKMIAMKKQNKLKR